MLDSNLAVLLAERNLKITKVARDTGISRTTLTALCYDQSAGIKYDTLNTLCKYLHITPGDLFSYTDYDYEIKFNGRMDPDSAVIKGFDDKVYGYDADVVIMKDNMTWNYHVGIVISPGKDKAPLENVQATVLPYYAEDSDDATAMDIQAAHEFQCMLDAMTKRQLMNMSDKFKEIIEPEFIGDYSKDNKCKKDKVLASDDALTIRASFL